MSRTTRKAESTRPEAVLYMSLELGASEWKLGFAGEAGQKPRQRQVAAGDLNGLMLEIGRARQRFALPDSARVVSCYEAGRDGFWLHRFLLSEGITNVVTDSSSIEVSRRYRRAKTDRLDAEKLLSSLIRFDRGEKKVFGVAHAPTPVQEDERHWARELESLKQERTAHTNRIKALLVSVGSQAKVDQSFLEHLDQAKQGNGTPLLPSLRARLKREWERLTLLESQIKEVERSRRQAEVEATEKVRRLQKLKGIGENSAWLFAVEFFGWRQFRNRREVASLAGLTPMPYQSGDTVNVEQGISKAGNRRVRAMAIEIAWGWLRFQPQSRLSLWFQERYGRGNRRSRRVGIVAVARKLLIALWRYLDHGVIPEGAELKAK
ncbi:MAG TPA: IS110 family transposase [Thermoanaerobaculia bacterium]